MATGRGGAGRGQGRKPTKSSLPGGPAFAVRVIERIPELNKADGKPYKSAEDYALELLGAQDVRIRKETFLAMLYWQFGKPTQMVEPLSFDPSAPLHVIVEHIGKSKNTASAKTK